MSLKFRTENQQRATFLERRRSQRIKICFRATVRSRDITFEGVIDDLSENGVNVLTYSSESPIEFSPESHVVLNFQPTSRETLNLHCNVKWAEKLQPRASKYRIGMEIINPPWEGSISFL